MKRSYLLILLFFILLAFKQDASELPVGKKIFKLPVGITAKDYLPNTLVIKFKSGKKLNVITESAGDALKKSGITLSNIDPIFRNANQTVVQQAEGEENVFHFENYFLAKYNGNAAIEQVINTLLQNDDIDYVEPSYIHTTWYTPNDASYGAQFSLSQVKAPQAWEIIKNSSNVIIGIVDSGSETTHQDLAANIYLNTADPINGIDDDGDGYIDNYYGWDFCGQSASTMIGDNDPNVKSSATEHGVHVSGIASAVSNNGIGVASLAFNAKLLIVKAGADDNGQSIYKGYEGIKYAADKGAHIINCSWGGVGGGQFGQEMVNYAIAKGCLIIAAAGNSANDIPIYPAAYDGVLAVANLDQNDKKGRYSNYGTYVDLSAPGEGIYNTIYNNSYGYYSGTSMSAPLVASAAALIKAKYPQYTALQIGELLRATADNIDQQNPDYIHKLGKGRLNVYRALTEAASSVRYQSINITDQSLGNRAPGTEIALNFVLKNFLAPVTGLNVNISTTSSYVQILDPQINVGNLANLETKNNIGPVRVRILANAPENHELVFNLTYTGNGGTYTDFESFSTVVALDYLNVAVNKVSTTLSSNGRVGYSKANATAGLGFIYKDENMLYEAALMIAKSETQVVNNARFDVNYSNDFKKQQTAALVQHSTAAFEGASIFTDAGSSTPIGLRIKSRLLAFNQTNEDKYVIVEYEIANQSANDLDGIYTGLFTDWDLDEASSNATKYDDVQKIAYVYAKKNASYPYAGVRLLSNAAPAAYYPLSYQLPNSLLSDNIFTIAEKYKSLTSGIKDIGLGYNTTDGYDVMFTIGSGPYRIPKNGSIKVAYAFMGGDNLNDLFQIGMAAQAKYNDLESVDTKVVPPISALKQNYPNAANRFTYIPFDLSEQSLTTLTIYDIMGKKMTQVVNEDLTAGAYRIYVDVSKFSSGTYLYRLKTAHYSKTMKMIIGK